MEAWYLHNSGFALFLKNALLIFDYYDNAAAGRDKNISGGVIGREDLMKRENVYVFSSHIHGDHYNPAIFAWQEVKPDIKYFLDSAIQKNARHKNITDAVYMQKGNVYKDGAVFVQAFGSTDEGISFYIETEGAKIFHAGDLNFWHWRESSTKSEAGEAANAFYREMSDIEKDIKSLNIAFFPVDPVMGRGFDEGAVYFIEKMKPEYFIPMHCRGDLKATYEAFSQKMAGSATKILTYSSRGQKLYF
jgi:L-ascorbate metabolism protein UlaG (beta-lactamase superfamily)